MAVMAFGALPASAIEVLVRNAQYYAPTKGPYVESNILILGSSVAYAPNDHGSYNGSVEVTILFKQANGEVAAIDKYALNTIDVLDTANVNIGIVDKKRFLLKNGSYIMEATFTDLISGDQQSMSEAITIDFKYDTLQISDIDLVEEYETSSDDKSLYVRSGLYMTPYVINFYPDNVNKLSFYMELYNGDVTTNNTNMLVTYSIKKTGQNDIPYGHYHYKKVVAEPVNAFFGEFDISMLPSGNYDLVVEVRDRENQIIGEKKMFFQRSKLLAQYEPNDVEDVVTTGTFAEQFNIEELKYQLRSVNAIATVQEAQSIKGLLKSDDEALLERFFLNFWMTRNDVDPQKAWQEYADKVKQVNFEFGSNLNYGFETDRGRIYLKYGAPNQLYDMPREPGAYPYQIWHYYNKTGQRSNVRFVFYNPDLISNDYELIHSTTPGEIYNEQWESLIYGTFSGGNTPTDRGFDSDQIFGGRARELFNR